MNDTHNEERSWALRRGSTRDRDRIIYTGANRCGDAGTECGHILLYSRYFVSNQPAMAGKALNPMKPG